MLEGKIALVTGATKNNGFGMAKVFSELGATVFVNGEDRDAVETAVRDLQTETGGSFYPAYADVSVEAQVMEMMKHVGKTAGHIDILVNNACHLGLGYDFFDTPVGFFDQVIAVNLRGYFLCGREAAKAMRETQTRGAIVNIGSVTATRAILERSAYIASKGGIEAMSRAMAIELAPYGIRVNCVNPGYLHTERWDAATEEELAKRRANIPLGFEAYPEDIAHAVAFLASDGARNITGAIIPVTGGKDIQLTPRERELKP